jgi:hypothetical protein
MTDERPRHERFLEDDSIDIEGNSQKLKESKQNDIKFNPLKRNRCVLLEESSENITSFHLISAKSVTAIGTAPTQVYFDL